MSDDVSSIIPEEIRGVIPNQSSISVDDNRKLLVDTGGKHAYFHKLSITKKDSFEI